VCNNTAQYLCVCLEQTWECIDVNNGVSSGDVLYNDVNAKQVEAERLLKSDCQTPKFLGIRLKRRSFQLTRIHLHTPNSCVALIQEWTEEEEKVLYAPSSTAWQLILFQAL